MSLRIATILLFLSSLPSSLCFPQVQLSNLRYSKNVDSQINKEEFLFSPARMLGKMSASCYSNCLNEMRKSGEENYIEIILGPFANYTLAFPIPDYSFNFTLKITPSPQLNYSILFQKARSTDLVSFENSLTKEEDWMKLFLYGKTLTPYKGGKAAIKLFNSANNTSIITLEIIYDEPSNSVELGLIFGLLFGAFVYVPLFFCLVCSFIKILKRIKEQWLRKKEQDRRLHPVLPSLYRGDIPQTRGASDTRIDEENSYHTHIVIPAGQTVSLYASQEIDNSHSTNGHSGFEDRQEPYIVGMKAKKPGAKTLALLNQVIEIHFPKTKFERLQSSFPQQTCSVCLEELGAGMDCRQLFCQHIFHSECIELWLQNQFLKEKACCPNCNIDMATYEF